MTNQSVFHQVQLGEPVSLLVSLTEHGCHRFPSIAMIKHHSQKQPGEERAYTSVVHR